MLQTICYFYLQVSKNLCMLGVVHVDHGGNASKRPYYFLSENILTGFDTFRTASIL